MCKRFRYENDWREAVRSKGDSTIKSLEDESGVIVIIAAYHEKTTTLAKLMLVLGLCRHRLPIGHFRPLLSKTAAPGEGTGVLCASEIEYMVCPDRYNGLEKLKVVE